MAKEKSMPVPFRRRLEICDDTTKQLYLTALAKFGRKYEAARVAGISPSTIQREVEDDEDFAEAQIHALQTYGEMVTREVERRAIEGWDEAVYQKGERVGTIRKYSDRLLEMHAKRFVPEYREKFAVEATVTGGVVAIPAPASTSQWEERYANAVVITPDGQQFDAPQPQSQPKLGDEGPAVSR